jgi:hypothetical protein
VASPFEPDISVLSIPPPKVQIFCVKRHSGIDLLLATIQNRGGCCIAAINLLWCNAQTRPLSGLRSPKPENRYHEYKYPI